MQLLALPVLKKSIGRVTTAIKTNTPCCMDALDAGKNVLKRFETNVAGLVGTDLVSKRSLPNAP